MTELLLKILDMSLSATWLAIAVMVLRLVLRKAPKRLNVLLWGLVALRMVCPFTIESPLSQIPEPVSRGAVIQDISDGYVGDIEIIHDNRSEFQEAVSAGRTPVSAGEGSYYVVTAPDKVSAPNTVGNTVFPVLAWVWLAGVIGMVLYTLLSYSAVVSRVRTAFWLRDNIYQSEEVASPFVFGMIKPRIYLPTSMEELDMYHVIAHERTHICRKDHWWKLLGFLLLALHWFNPVMWLSYVLLCRDIELACDEQVIKNMRPDQRANYSQALLNCSIQHRTISACPLAFGEVGVKKRIQSVLTYKKPGFRVIAIAVILCGLVAVCFMTDPVETPEHLTETLTTLDTEDVQWAQATFWNDEQAHTLLSDDQTEELVTILNGLTEEDFQESPGFEHEISLMVYCGQREILLASNGEYVEFLLDTSSTVPTHSVTWAVQDGKLLDFFSRLSQEEPNWGVTITIEALSSTGATLLFQQKTRDLVLWGGNDYVLQEKIDGSWTDVPTLTEPSFTAEAYNVANIRRHEINWEWLYGSLPAGHYRISKRVSLLEDTGMRQSGIIYAEFTLEDGPTPYTITSTLTADGVRASADFHHGGGGYVFFKEEAAELVEILNGLTQEAFLPSPGITAHTTIELGLDSSSLLLHNDGEYTEFEIQGNGDMPRWAVREDALNAFFVEMNKNSASESTYEIYNVAPLETLSNHYTLEEAAIDKCVIMVDGDVWSNQDVWFDFMQSCSTGQVSTVRLLHHYSATEDTESSRYIYDLTFDGSVYYLRWFEGEKEYNIRYPKLLHEAGPSESPEEPYDAYDRYILDNYGSWLIVYEDRILYPDHPSVPANWIDATLEQNGVNLLTTRDPEALAQLQEMFAHAQWISEPKTYSLGLILTLTDGTGNTTQIELDLGNDLCVINGQFYDYGPGVDDNGALDARETLFHLLGVNYTDTNELLAILNGFGNDPVREAERLREALKLQAAQ